MAGAGYKLFNTGDVLLASEVNTYLMQQTVMVFANATARTSALSGVLAEGMLSYLADTNATEVYDGSAWVSVSGTGDITAVTTGANSGLAGGVTTGNADIKINFASKGQLAVGTGSGTTDFLNVGTNGYTLVADSTETTGLKWAAPASGSTFVGVSVYQANLQTIANNTATALTFTSENYDTDGFHSTVSNTSRLTVPSGKGGYYEIKMQGYWDQSGTGIRQARLYKNGAVLMYSGDFETDDATAYVPSMVSMVTNLAAGDYIEFYVYQTSGGNLSFFRYIDSFVGTMTYLGA